MKTSTTVSIGAAARADNSTATLPSRPLAAASRAFHRADPLDANPATPARLSLIHISEPTRRTTKSR
ncbi:hypothetical protein KDX16_33315, partial [Burkholderia vietnamiensis]|uniref:hypothetical protein n=1 Tax=Burkholderia vietnamiensis TaxID=60552 RepID=UPI001B9E2EC5